MRDVATFATVGLAALALTFGACIEKHDPVSPETAALPEGRACPADVGMISDGESANKTTFTQGRGGYWYTFLDTKDDGGSTIWPLSGGLGGTFEMSEGGAEQSLHHARMKGTVGNGEVAFWAKKNPGSTDKVRLKVPDVQTDPDGKQCKQCFNDHGLDLSLFDQWTLYTVPFRIMKQEDWGPKDNGIDASGLYGIQFQVKEKGATFDISVDQIHFTGCP